MNYTENLHLPQWELSDRVLMDDFNDAMGRIDTGITQNTQTVSGKADLEGLFRLAYNRWHLLASLDAPPRQIGFFHQDMDPIPENAQGFFQRNGCGWLSSDSVDATADMLKAAFSQSSPLVVTPSMSTCKKMMLTFTAPASMLLERITMYTTIDTGTTGTKGPLHYVVRNLTTGAVETDATMVIGLFTNVVGPGNAAIPFNTYIHRGHKYRIEVEPMEAGYTATFDCTDSKTKVFISDIEYPSGSVSYTLSEGEESHGGLVLVRYKIYNAGGTIELEWDGAPCTPYQIRTFAGADGVLTSEAEYRRMGTIPAKSELRLRMDCKELGEMALYSWGAMFI